MIDKLARGDWHMVWPDRKVDRALPKIPNYIDLALRHRARLVAEQMPTIAKRPTKLTDEAKKKAECIERYLYGYWDRSHIGSFKMHQWGGDAMVAGLAVCRVLPDLTQTDKTKRFPLFHRIDPRICYPSPTFAEGPFIDDMVTAENFSVYEVENTYDHELGPMLNRAMKLGNADQDQVRVYQFYDKERVLHVAEAMFENGGSGRREFEVLADYAHELGKCPVVIGTRPSHDGAYRGDFDQMPAMLNTANRMMTMHLDSAAEGVYPTIVVDGEVENPNDRGPGAIIQVANNQGNVLDHIDFLRNPAGPYDNYQLMRTVDTALRTAALLPPSVTGDPNESVTSAAGIGATQSMPNAEVISLQRDTIGPMLQAANEIALMVDEKHCDADKTITGTQRGSAFVERYTPSKHIAGDYSNDVVYGLGAGADKVTTGVMVLQAKGEGLLPDRLARELHPITSDYNPIDLEAMFATEQMTKASFSALIAGAAAPPGDPRALSAQQIADIWDDLEKPGVTLKEAIRNHLTDQQAALAPVPETGAPALASPGIAGAGEPQPPAFNGPPLQELMGA